MKKEMLINVLQSEECRIAIVENGVLEELYVERASHENYVGNIYKGRIVNIEPSIQAAFVDFGVGRNGFLHVSDVEPAYYKHIDPDAAAAEGRDLDLPREGTGRSGRPPSGGSRDSRGGSRGGRDSRGGGGRRPSNDVDRRRQLYQELEQDLVAADQELPVPEAAEPELLAPRSLEEAQEGGSPEEQEKQRSRRRRGRPGRGRRGVLERTGEENSSDNGDAPSQTGEGNPLPLSENRPEGRDDGGAPLMGSSEHRTSPPDDDDELLVFNRKRPIPETEVAPAVEETAVSLAPLSPVQATTQKIVVSSTLPTSSTEDEAPLVFRSSAPRTVVVSAVDVETPVPMGGAKVQRMSVTETVTPVVTETGDEDLVFGRPAAKEAKEVIPVPVQEPYRAPREPRREPRPPALRPEPRHEPRPERIVVEVQANASEEGEPNEDGDADERNPGGRDRRGSSAGGPRRRPGRDAGRSGDGERPKPPIQEIFKRGQEVIVQVIKEGIGTKGPTLSTYISIAGRYLVLMPGLNRVGVSRKIMDDEQRRRLRDIFNDLKPPTGLGFIIRTAGVDKSRSEIQRDLAYLSRLWQVVARRIKKVKSPAEVYQESDMITRTIRDTFTNDIDTIWVDERSAFEHAQEFLQFVMPQHADRIKFYEGKEPLFHKYGLEDEIARMNQKKVPLSNGGSIIIEQTEALVAIDVNSGSFRTDGNNAEDTAYQMNLQAAREIARQLRLRDLGGVIVNDFIDMRDERHRRGVEKAMKEALRRDRARTKLLRISAFGLIEMTRQRIRPSLKRSVFTDCANCRSLGYVKTSESMSLEVVRLIQLATCNSSIRQVIVRVTDDVARYLLNRKRRDIVKLEEMGNFQVEVQSLPGAPPEVLEMVCFDHNDHEVRLMPAPVEIPSGPRGGRRF
jgi:ribonuclease E